MVRKIRYFSKTETDNYCKLLTEDCHWTVYLKPRVNAFKMHVLYMQLDYLRKESETQNRTTLPIS